MSYWRGVPLGGVGVGGGGGVGMPMYEGYGPEGGRYVRVLLEAHGALRDSKQGGAA